MVVNQAAKAQQILADSLPNAFFDSLKHEDLEQPLFNYHHHSHHHTHPLDQLSRYPLGLLHSKDHGSHGFYPEMPHSMAFPSAHTPGIDYLTGTAFDHSAHKHHHSHGYPERDREVGYRVQGGHHTEQGKDLYRSLQHFEHEMRKELSEEYGHLPPHEAHTSAHAPRYGPDHSHDSPDFHHGPKDIHAYEHEREHTDDPIELSDEHAYRHHRSRHHHSHKHAL